MPIIDTDYNNWNELKKATHKSDSLIGIRVGEIRWCKFGVNIGKEIIGKGTSFRRPVLIIKKFSGDVFLGLPLTTKEHKGDWYYEIKHEGVSRTVIFNQGRVLDRKRLEEKLFEISELELEEIKKLYCALIMKL